MAVGGTGADEAGEQDAGVGTLRGGMGRRGVVRTCEREKAGHLGATEAARDDRLAGKAIG